MHTFISLSVCVCVCVCVSTCIYITRRGGGARATWVDRGGRCPTTQPAQGAGSALAPGRGRGSRRDAARTTLNGQISGKWSNHWRRDEAADRVATPPVRRRLSVVHTCAITAKWSNTSAQGGPRRGAAQRRGTAAFLCAQGRGGQG